MRRRREHSHEGERAEGREHQHDRERQPEVTDPVDQERLLRRHRRGGFVGPEPDEQVRRETDTLPADVEQQEVVGQDQQQHRRHEQVQLAEEAAPVEVVLHVADRVNVDQRPDSGDQEHEHTGKRVEQQVGVGMEAADGDPSEEVLVDLTGLSTVTADQSEEHDQPDDERRDRGRTAEQMPPRVGAATAQQQHGG